MAEVNGFVLVRVICLSVALSNGLVWRQWMAWAVHTESARHGTAAAAGDNGLHEQGSAQIELTWRWPPAGSRACAAAGCKSHFPPCLLPTWWGASVSSKWMTSEEGQEPQGKTYRKIKRENLRRRTLPVCNHWRIKFLWLVVMHVLSEEALVRWRYQGEIGVALWGHDAGVAELMWIFLPNCCAITEGVSYHII